MPPFLVDLPAESRRTIGHELMIEFTGIRWTEADAVARKARLKDDERQKGKEPRHSKHWSAARGICRMVACRDPT